MDIVKRMFGTFGKSTQECGIAGRSSQKNHNSHKILLHVIYLYVPDF